MNNKPDESCTSPVQTHALQLALKTMNERCQQLQQRLITVEEENIKLKSINNKDTNKENSNGRRPSDYEQLREKVEELTRQKTQLTQHINMVATENRHLWTRLSKMTKDNHSINSQSPKLVDSIEQPSSLPKTPQHHIIRSKTFTQSTPNTKLCPKIGSDSDLSLEEISLKLINNFIQDKSVLEEQYEQMVEMHSDIDSDEAGGIDLKNIGFSYITDNNDDSGIALKECMDAYKQIKNQVLDQKKFLNELLNILKSSNRDKPVCSKCKSSIDLNTTPANETVYKECVNETKWATPVASTTELIKEDTDIREQSSHHNLFRPISEDNLKLDGPETHEETEEDFNTMVSAVCPICNEVFTNMSLNDLTDHVESHFSEENDITIDSNFEIVTNTIGNF